MTPHTRHILMTLAYAFVAGTLASSSVAWLLVPAQLSVEYLTPITLAGPVVGLLIGGIVVRVGLPRRALS
jgi:hypothetical protein